MSLAICCGETRRRTLTIPAAAMRGRHTDIPAATSFVVLAERGTARQRRAQAAARARDNALCHLVLHALVADRVQAPEETGDALRDMELHLATQAGRLGLGHLPWVHSVIALLHRVSQTTTAPWSSVG